MPRIKIGVQVQPQHADIDGMRRAWAEAEEMGCDAIFNWDHFYPLYDDPDGKHFEALTTMAAMAEVTERAQIGSLVICNSYRNPEYLVDAHRTLDHVSGGRAILGIGAGWFKRDYDEYGYDFGTADERLKNLERGLEIIKDRWEKDPPRPLRGTVPILIGGGGEKVMLRITAQHADLWNGFGPLDNFTKKNAILDEWCAKVGRDPAAVERTVRIDAPEFGLLDDYVAAGATHFICGGNAPFEFEDLQQLIAWRDSRA